MELESGIETVSEENPSKALDSFIYALKSAKAQEQYLIRLRYFFNFLKLNGESINEQAAAFLSKANEDKQWAYDSIISFINHYKQRIRNRELAACTLTNYYNPVKLFCEMNDIDLNWRKISRGLPSAKSAAKDRSPTIEEIRKVIEYPDRRIKFLVYVMASSGIRIGAWDFIKYKHFTPIYSPKNNPSSDSSKAHSLCW